LLSQLDALGLRAFFDEILTAEPRGGASWRAKVDLIEASRRARPGLTILGDTEVDIRAGKALGMWTVAVTSGIRSRASLEAEHPDQIVDSLRVYACDVDHLSPIPAR
jgi:phosphoglycolate phosphatase-like HAD superfamily hydrolase